MKIAIIYAGIVMLICGLSLFLLFAVINPMTLKIDDALCFAFGSGNCGALYGGILSDFRGNSTVFSILSALLASFGMTILAINNLTTLTKKVDYSFYER